MAGSRLRLFCRETSLLTFDSRIAAGPDFFTLAATPAVTLRYGYFCACDHTAIFSQKKWSCSAGSSALLIEKREDCGFEMACSKSPPIRKGKNQHAYHL